MKLGNTDFDADAMYVFFTTGEKAVSNIICRVDGGPFSHMGVGFKGKSEEIYYEALVGKGFAGPRQFTDLVSWQMKKPGRKLLILEIPSLASCAEQKRIVTETYSHVLTYSEWQLVALFCFIKFGWTVEETLTRVICSEIVARICAPEMDLRDSKHKIFDVVTPGSAWRKLNALNRASMMATGSPFYMVRYAAGLKIEDEE